MRKGRLTREQAIDTVGLAKVLKVEAENCDFTNRVMQNEDVEFSASIKCKDKAGDNCTLVAYYYQDKKTVDEIDDLGSLNWEIEGYEII